MLFIAVKVLQVEWVHSPGGEPAMTQLMEMNKYVKFGLIELHFARDVVYVKDFLENVRLYEDIPPAPKT